MLSKVQDEIFTMSGLSNQLAMQLKKRIYLAGVKISKFSTLKPLHAAWIFDFCKCYLSFATYMEAERPRFSSQYQGKK